MKELSTYKKEKLKKIITDIAEPKLPLKTEVKPKLPPLQGIKMVLYDVYGTILISGTEPMERKKGESQIQAFTKTLDRFLSSYQPDAPQNGILQFHQIIQDVHKQKKAEGIDYPEVNIIDVCRRLFEWMKAQTLISDFEDEQIPDIVTDFVTRYDKPWLMPGLKEILNHHRQANLITGIISNSQFYTPLTLEALSGSTLNELGFDPELLFWSFAEDIAKPSVKFYEIAVQKLKQDYDVSPEEVLFVGNDMLNDVYPAQVAGFKTVLFAGDRRSLRLREDDDRCQNIEPDVIVTNLKQIQDVLT